MEQLVIVLLIALISLVNWLVKKSAELREARKQEKAAMHGQPSGPPPIPEAEPQISLRNLREALGLPEEEEPPTLPKRVEQKIPPPLPPPPPPPRPQVRPVISHAPALEFHRFVEAHHRISKPAGRPAEEMVKRSRVRELLGSSGGLRDAVVLSEILGQPKCLRAPQGRTPQ